MPLVFKFDGTFATLTIDLASLNTADKQNMLGSADYYFEGSIGSVKTNTNDAKITITFAVNPCSTASLAPLSTTLVVVNFDEAKTLQFPELSDSVGGQDVSVCGDRIFELTT